LVKKTGTHTIAGYYANAGGDLGGGFDISGSFSNGSLYNNGNVTNRIRRVEQWGTDVYRCSETFTMTASGTITAFRLAPVSGVTTKENSAVGTELAFAAPQIELGSVPTSFIPTTTGSVTRDADVINKTSASGLIGQTEGVLYAEFVPPSGSTGRVFAIDDGSVNNRIVINRATTTRMEVIVRSSGSVTGGTISSSAATAFNPDVPTKVAYAYKSGDFALAINGSVVASGTATFTFTSSLNALGTSESTIGIAMNRLRSAAIYKTRLPNYLLESATSQIQSYSALASSLSYTVV
jgi:hypothetical protein